jgi:hypothetical protein
VLQTSGLSRFNELIQRARTTLTRELAGLPLNEEDGLAVAYLSEATELAPDSAAPFSIAAAMSLWSKNLELASLNAQRALARDPCDVTARLILWQLTQTPVAINALPSDEALKELLGHYSRLGVHPAAAMGQLFRSAVTDLKLAMAGLRELSPNLTEDQRAWIQPWTDNAEQLVRLGESHAAILTSAVSGTNCSAPTWTGSTN